MNYGEIRTQFKAILNRSDCSDAMADNFINMGLARTQRVLRTPWNEQSAVTTVTGGFSGITVPTSLQSIISVDCDGLPVTYLPPDRFREMSVTSSSGSPDYFTRIGSSLRFFPTPASGKVITVWYYGAFDAFTNTTTVTTLSTNAADLVIYGGLVYAADYFLDERKDTFDQRYMQFAQEVSDMSLGYDGPLAVMPTYDINGGY